MTSQVVRFCAVKPLELHTGLIRAVLAAQATCGWQLDHAEPTFITDPTCAVLNRISWPSVSNSCVPQQLNSTSRLEAIASSIYFLEVPEYGGAATESVATSEVFSMFSNRVE